MKFLPGEEFLPGWEPLLQMLAKSAKTVSREFYLKKRVYIALTSYG